jgi:capsular polysaccharide biosynthesis protein
MENFFTNMNLLRIIGKWKWHLLILVVIAAIVSIIVSSPWVTKPRFKSVAVIYPSNIAPYSDESETEQMLQWLTSKDVRDSIMIEFNLPKHYGIDSGYKYFASTMAYLYDKFVKISKTQYESIEITVLDRDPVIARNMVNAIIRYTDGKIRATHYVKYAEVEQSFRKAMAMKQHEIDSVKEEMRKITSTYGIYELEGQSQEITRGELRTVDGGGSAIDRKNVELLKQGMREKGSDLLFLSNRVKDIANEYSEMMLKADLAIYDVNKEYTFINIVSPATVADKKSYPKRLLVMFYFVAGTLLLSLIAIAVIEQRRAFMAREDKNFIQE